MGSRFGPRSAVGGALGFLLISAMMSAGCVNKTGETLPPSLMSFPIAIELSPDVDDDGEPRFLYVTSSNFALEYNSGNVQSYDLERLVDGVVTGCVDRWVLDSCVADGDDLTSPDCQCEPLEAECTPLPAGIRQSCLESSFEGDVEDPACECDPLVNDNPADTCVAVPFDRCTVIDDQLVFRDLGAALRIIRVQELLRAEVLIGSFSDGLGISTNGRRLYLPVRSDANLTFIDVDEEGRLACGEAFGTRHTCTEAYRSGSAQQVNPTVQLSLPADPVDVFVGSLSEDFEPPGNPQGSDFSGDYILMAHRERNVSLFFDQDRPGTPEPSRRPRLAATLDGLAPEQVTITYQPDERQAWVPSADARAIVRVGVAVDGDPTQSFLFDAGFLFVTGLDDGTNNRDVRFDPRPGRDLAYIVSRAPEAVVVARTDTAGGDLRMVNQISACRDPSRIQVAEVPARGQSVLLAFISCFLSRSVQVIDLDKLQGITIVTNISGAFEFAIDRPRLLLYVADFSTSVIRVADLRPLVSCLEATSTVPRECSPRLIGLIGLPQPVSELPR